jgi:O-antigen ligase
MVQLTMPNIKNMPILNIFITTCITLSFWLLHTNQSSSQSAATFLLLFVPFCLFFIKDTEINKHKALIITFSLILLFTIYNFLVLTQHEFNKLSILSYRALFFWLLFPIASILIWKAKPSRQWVLIIFSLAAIFSLSPVIRDHLNGAQRGFSSGHPIFWGDIALCSGMIAFALRTSIPKDKWANSLGYIALICGIVASAWSQTRGGWISIPISLILLLSFRSINKWQAAFAIVILVVAASSNESIKNRITHTFQNSNVFTEEIKLGSSTQARLDMWQAAFIIFQEKPLLGGGFDSYQKNAKELVEQGRAKRWAGDFEKPHNEYLNTLVTSGLIGLLMLSSIILSMLYIFHRLVKKTPYKLAGYLLISQFLIFSLSEVFFSTKLTIIYFCIASALIIYTGLEEDENA